MAGSADEAAVTAAADEEDTAAAADEEDTAAAADEVDREGIETGTTAAESAGEAAVAEPED